MTMSKLLLAIAILVGGAVFATMGWSMWIMKGMMVSMATNMDHMSTYMKNMGAPDGYMSTMSSDMAGMKTYMRNMAGTPAELAEYHKTHPDYTVSDVLSEKHTEHPCTTFLQWMTEQERSAGAGFADLRQVKVDEVPVRLQGNESFLASMRRDMSEMDEHMFCMYLAMSADMAAMRNSMNVMTPSIASMGPTMGVMGRDMNRGVRSFTSPMQYMFNAMH